MADCKSETVLGLDIGANSLGWALVKLSKNKAKPSGEIIGVGVRIFQAGIENFDSSKEKSKSEDRRKYRGNRRRLRRLAQRKRKLVALLRDNQMFPADLERETSDPYFLRKKGLEERLTLIELGRVLYHLCQRRGFATARKTEVKRTTPKKKNSPKNVEESLSSSEEKTSASNHSNKEEKKTDILADISELAAQIEESGEKTLGAYFSSLQNPKSPKRIRGRHTRRSMYKDEFERLWAKQSEFAPKRLTDSLKRQIENIIFYQRPIYWKLSTIGECELEPGEKRCLRADRLAQEFRLLQEVNNLKYIDPITNQEVRVAETDKYQALIDAMKAKKEIDFNQIRKILGLEQSVGFNLETAKKSAKKSESTGRSKLKGMETDWILRKEEYFGKACWDKKAEDEKNEIVRILCERTRNSDVNALKQESDGKRKSGQEKLLSDEELRKIIVDEWGINDDKRADDLLDVADSFPCGRLQLSRKAIAKLLPFMRKGRLYSGDPTTDALHAAGYRRPDERDWKKIDFLPALDLKHCSRQKIDEATRNAVAAIRNLPAITNPVVRQCVAEVRKLVNALIREYGRPDLIRVELARDAKANSEQRSAMRTSNNENQKANEAAATFIKKYGIKRTHDTILRYRLWKEQNEICPYTQKPISVGQLFNGETDVDHIIPRAQGGEDARINKVVCFRKENEEKGNQTPRQWLQNAANSERYERVLAAVQRLPYAKRTRFRQESGNLDNFVDRQLNDTKYASRYVKQYLSLLYENDGTVRVQSVRGNQTAALRHSWGLNHILHDDIVPNDLPPGQKNRADHRHHAVDALVIALTDAPIVRKLVTWDKIHSLVDIDKQPLPPWSSLESFQADVSESIRAIIVSHAPNRRVRGPLCEETKYGFVNQEQNNGRNLVRRKPLASLSRSEVLDIRDKTIRRKVLDFLEKEHGIRLNQKGTKLNCSNAKLKVALSAPFYLHPEEERTPIKKVRILISDKSVIPMDENREDSPRIKPGKNHHIRIFEWIERNKKGKDELVRDVFFTTQMEVNRRNHQRFCEIRRRTKELPATLSPEEREMKIREIRRNVDRQIPLIERTLSPEESNGRDAKFVMSLSVNETLEITNVDIDQLTEENPKTTLVLYKTGASTSKQLFFSDIRSAFKKPKKSKSEQENDEIDSDEDTIAEDKQSHFSDKYGKNAVERFSVSLKRLFRKVQIDILGNIYPAGD